MKAKLSETMLDPNNPFELRRDNVVPYTPIRPIVQNNSLTLQTAQTITGFQIQGHLSTKESIGYSYLAKSIVNNALSEELCFIKTPKINPQMPHHEIKARLDKARASFDAEWQQRERISDLNKKSTKVAAVITAFSHYSVRDSSDMDWPVPYLVQEYVDEYSIEAYFPEKKKYLDPGTQKFTGITDPVQWFSIVEKVVDIVRRVHNRQIVHGELVPKNILLAEDGSGEIKPILVDFGNSFLLLASPSGKGRELRSDPYLAPERRDPDSPWYTPADIYSLGGVLYYLSTGERPPDIGASDLKIFPERSSWANPTQHQIDAWKDLIHDGFTKNKGLMARNEGIVKVIDKCLRPNPVDRYLSAEKLLQAIQALNYRARKVTPVSEALNGLSEEWKSQEGPQRPLSALFEHIITDKLEMARKELVDMVNGHYEVYGEREDITDTLVKYLGLLEGGDNYVTVTVPEYWTEDNLGVNGRFLTVNKDLARNGVFVNRLFLLSPEDLIEGSSAIKILAAHLKAWKELGEHSANVFTSDSPSGTGKMFIGILPLSSKDEVRSMQKELNHVAIWASKDNSKRVSIMFSSVPVYKVYDEKSVVTMGSKIAKVRFMQLTRAHEYSTLCALFNDPGVIPLSERMHITEPIHRFLDSKAAKVTP
jgi:serine/threonine protein kinase